MSLGTFYKIITLSFILFCYNMVGISQTITTFEYTGSLQTYVVPAGTGYLMINAIGAAGGRGKGADFSDTVTNNPGGNGGEVHCKLAVTAGQIIYIYVGGKGADGNSSGAAGGFNGGGNASDASSGNGGGGGGGTDIRIIDTSIYDRVVVAGGGGGGGGLSVTTGCTGTSDGGAGGGAYGGNGLSCGSYSSLYCGSGASPSHGGTRSASTDVVSDGSFWQGGASGHLFSGGGGGGGLFGGGGGFEGGGGGGSAFADTDLASSITMTTGGSADTGNGKVTLTTLPTSAVSEIGRNKSIQLYPNPASDKLTIRLDNKLYSLLRITNSIGQIMLRQAIGSASITIDIHQFPSAVYNIMLTGEVGIVNKQFIKE